MLERDGMRLERYGRTRLFRPRASTEASVRAAAETNLLSAFAPGEYTEAAKINEVLQHHYDFYSDRFEQLLPDVSSHSLLALALYSFDGAYQIEEDAKTGALPPGEAGRWSDLDHCVKRSLKYICERLASTSLPENPRAPRHQVVSLAEELWVCSEEMVKLYLASDQTYRVLPDHSVLVLDAPGKRELFSLGPIESHCGILAFPGLVARDAEGRERFGAGVRESKLTAVSWHSDILGSAFQETIGMSDEKAVGLFSP